MNIPFRKTLAVLAFTGSAGLTGAAQAVPIVYEGGLIAGLPSTGSVGGFSWFLGQASGVDFWSFTANANIDVTLRVDRLNANLDPAVSLYQGVTAADTSTYDSTASFGGLSYIGSLDDEASPFLLPGPNGDPRGTFRITTAGVYTVAVGGNGSTDAGSYPYRITISVAAVPEPAPLALLTAGLAAVLWRRRRSS